MGGQGRRLHLPGSRFAGDRFGLQQNGSHADRAFVSLYDVLGVSADASLDQIKEAYHVRARLVHPDHHQGAPPNVLAEAEREMAMLNEAYATLSDPARRDHYDRELGGQTTGTAAHAPTAPRGAPPRPLRPDECRLCGIRPAVNVRFRSETGKVLWRTRSWMDGPFCSICGTAVFRGMTNRTLMTGWWGVISFFVNWVTIASNVSAYRKVRQLAGPESRDTNVASMFGRSLDPGKPLFRRFGVYSAVIAFAVVGALVAQDQSQPQTAQPDAATMVERNLPTTPTTSTFETTPTTSSSDLHVGDCVTYDETRSHLTGTVPCGAPHNAVVSAKVYDTSSCPIGTTEDVEDTTTAEYFCLNTSG